MKKVWDLERKCKKNIDKYLVVSDIFIKTHNFNPARPQSSVEKAPSIVSFLDKPTIFCRKVKVWILAMAWVIVGINSCKEGGKETETDDEEKYQLMSEGVWSFDASGNSTRINYDRRIAEFVSFAQDQWKELADAGKVKPWSTYFVNLNYQGKGEFTCTSYDYSGASSQSYNIALTSLNCQYNGLTTLDVSKNIALTGLNCSDNDLTNLDVSANIVLTVLYCDYNRISNLDVSKNIELTGLVCYQNRLTVLNVSANTALTSLWCGKNQLTALDVNNNTLLYELECTNNNITDLDVSTKTLLKKLYCDNNMLTALDVSTNTLLEELTCYENGLTNLDVSRVC